MINVQRDCHCSTAHISFLVVTKKEIYLYVGKTLCLMFAVGMTGKICQWSLRNITVIFLFFFFLKRYCTILDNLHSVKVTSSVLRCPSFDVKYTVRLIYETGP